MSGINQLIEQEFVKQNYLIELTEQEEEYTTIYFSSCGIFDGSDIEVFKSKIIEKNTFEFYKTRIKKASKHIFIRDLRHKWYAEGINKEINSIESMLEFLKQETKGSKIITLGSSAGGYAAVLFGILLNAEHIFSFSGQFVIPEVNNNYSSLIDLISTSNIPIFYLYPNKNIKDIEQFNLVKDFDNVYVLSLKSSAHGVPIVKDTLKSIINADVKTLKKMYNYKNKSIGERIFVIKHFGLLRFFSRIITKNIDCIRRKHLSKKGNK